MVGLTSVGAGSIVVVALLLMYPALKASSLVGTDLAQAIPLVAAAALGHLLFGQFSLVVAGSILLGAIPGAWLGAHISAARRAGSSAASSPSCCWRPASSCSMCPTSWCWRRWQWRRSVAACCGS